MKRLLGTLLAITGLLICTHLVTADIPDIGYDQTYFIVSDDLQAVRYDHYDPMPRRVFFPAQAGQVKLINPSPQKQSLIAYNYATGQMTSIRYSAALHNDHYLITVKNHTGRAVAETKLEVIRN